MTKPDPSGMNHAPMKQGRARGLSVRLKFMLSYLVFLLLAGGLLLSLVWVYLLRYVPENTNNLSGGFIPNRGDILRAFGPALASGMIFLLLFGAIGGWILAAKMLAPLARITNATRIAGDGALGHRVRLDDRSDEFRELADAFDNMMERLERHIGEQQRFAANASHELRTPLAITQTLLGVAASDPNRNVDDLIAKLRTVNTRAIALTESLLLLSRAGARPLIYQRVDLSLLVEETIETLLPLAEGKGVEITVSGGIANAFGSTSLLLQLTSNLVHNAIVHNLEAAGKIWISTSTDYLACKLVVENTGDVVSEFAAKTLAEPFQRGNGRTRDTERPGVGLGLAIAESVAHAHQGTLEIAPRSEGGLCITVTVPTSPHTGTGKLALFGN